jgi:hypothetical protein
MRLRLKVDEEMKKPDTNLRGRSEESLQFAVLTDDVLARSFVYETLTHKNHV